MGKFVDLTGKTFGRLLVLRRTANSPGTPSRPTGDVMYECQCSCDKHTILVIRGDSLVTGNTRSCGCINKEQITNLGRSLKIDLVGKTFGHLKVLRQVGKNKHGHILYECVCDCDNNTKCVVAGCHLVSGHTTSCGCYHLKRLSDAATKWKTEDEKELARRYADMKTRCYNKNNSHYQRWGGRGIYICDEWLDPVHGRENFISWSLANGFRSDLQIDRIDNDGPYAPWNCRWTTKEQQANNKRSNVFVDVDGERHTLAEWERLTGINRQHLSSLLSKGYDLFRDTVIFNSRVKSNGMTDRRG